ncbi:MAG: histidine phosphatase family protein [Desulfovibrio sp.]|nr:histidine phosphatase family protein [Desulfovibrio sp.]
MKGIWLVRHGALPPNPQRRFIGASDIPLSETGRTQFRALAAIYCSDLSRGRESAAILSASAPGVPLRPTPELREISLGRWEGRTPAEVERDFPGRQVIGHIDRLMRDHGLTAPNLREGGPASP